jgi:DNA-binding GntR family transcriptional regulator
MLALRPYLHSMDAHPIRSVAGASSFDSAHRGGERGAGLVYDDVRNMILEGELPPGAAISQVKLSAQMGVSRTPLREALRRLQQEGLIEAEPNRRARVVGFDADDLELVYTSRILFESLAIGLTVASLTTEEADGIEFALKAMRAAKKRDDYVAWESAHRDFHRRLVSHVDDKLSATISSFAQRGDRYRRLYQRAVAGGWNLGDADHELIANACRDRRARDASSELARHLARTSLSVLAGLRPEHDPILIRAAVQLVAGPPSN